MDPGEVGRLDWIDRLAEELGEETLSAQETERLLGVARDVAHRVERRITPLAAFLVGSAVGRSSAGRGSALEPALATLERLIPESTPEP
jgi:hypothetical protein